MDLDAGPEGTVRLGDLGEWRQPMMTDLLIGGMSAAAVLAVGILGGWILGGVWWAGGVLVGGLAALVMTLRVAGRATAHARAGGLMAVGPGHPWHTDDLSAGDGEVHLQFVATGWTVVPASGRIRVREDSLEDDMDVRLVDEANTLLGLWPDRLLTPARAAQLVHAVNMALAVAEVQVRDEGAEDEMEAAREREHDVESLLERDWGDTAAGQLQPQRSFLGRSRERED